MINLKKKQNKETQGCTGLLMWFHFSFSISQKKTLIIKKSTNLETDS